MDEPKDKIKITDEQRAYALVLEWAVKVGYLLLLAAAIVYFTGFVPSSVPLDEIHNYWGLELEEYHDQVHGPRAPWEWLRSLGTSDYLAFLPIAFLGLVTIACYLRIMPILLRKGEYIYLIIAGVEVLVLALSAAGVISGGH